MVVPTVLAIMMRWRGVSNSLVAKVVPNQKEAMERAGQWSFSPEAARQGTV